MNDGWNSKGGVKSLRRGEVQNDQIRQPRLPREPALDTERLRRAPKLLIQSSSFNCASQHRKILLFIAEKWRNEHTHEKPHHLLPYCRLDAALSTPKHMSR